MSVSVLLMAGAPASELEGELLRLAVEWARAVAPERVRTTAGDLAGPATETLNSASPLLVVWPELGVMRPQLASAAVGDLEGGCDMVLGPLFDGRLYLLGLARPIAPVLALDWQRENAISRGFALAAEARLEVGLLRAERGLRRAPDVRAALADPCLAASLRQLLCRPPAPPES